MKINNIKIKNDAIIEYRMGCFINEFIEDFLPKVYKKSSVKSNIVAFNADYDAMKIEHLMMFCENINSIGEMIYSFDAKEYSKMVEIISNKMPNHVLEIDSFSVSDIFYATLGNIITACKKFSERTIGSYLEQYFTFENIVIVYRYDMQQIAPSTLCYYDMN